MDGGPRARSRGSTHSSHGAPGASTVGHLPRHTVAVEGPAPAQRPGERDGQEDAMAAKRDDRKAFEALLRVKPGSKVNMARLDCGATFCRDKGSATDELAQVLARLTDLQAHVWAEARHAVLVVGGEGTKVE